MADALELLDLYEEKTHAFRRGDIPAQGYTYKDYLSWGEDVRVELIDGIPYMMGAPTEWHQWVAGEVFGQLRDWLKGKPCRVYVAPFNVRLFPKGDGSDKFVVQPDVLVVCDREKLSDGRACRGAPDFVVEVLSESSRGKDFGDKRNHYEKAGVREYWIVGEDRVYRYIPVDGIYRETVYSLDLDSKIDVDALPGCSIDFREIIGLALSSGQETAIH